MDAVFCFVANSERGLNQVDAKRNLFLSRVCVGALLRASQVGWVVAAGQVAVNEVAGHHNGHRANYTYALFA